MAHTQKDEVKVKRSRNQDSLSRSLIRTLIVFTFIPFILMAGAAYWRARTVFGDQITGQMQNQMNDQLNQLDLVIKAKQIRLDHLVRQPDFDSKLDSALSESPQNPDFTNVRNSVSETMRALNPQAGKATFNQFFLMLPNGSIQMASQPGWEGTSLANSQYYKTISESNNQTFAVYNLPPLYTNQFALITIAQYQSPSGSRLGTLVGITEAQNFQGILQSLANLIPGSNAYFATRDGKFIRIDQHTMELTALLPSASQTAQLTPVFNAMMNGGKFASQSVQFSNTANSPVLAEAAWLPSMDGGLVLEIQQSLVFGPLISLGYFTLILAVIALLAVALFSWLGTQSVFRPLQSLTAITTKFASGDFNVRADIHSQNEIGLLADAFNHMAEELTGLYRSLEQKVEERTRQIRTAAEVAQRATSAGSLDELLNRTVELIVEQFGFYHAAIYLVDRSGKYAILRAACSPAAYSLLESRHQLEVGSTSIIGWVSANNQPRIASDINQDPYYQANQLLSETLSEAGIPIAVGGAVLGTLDVQSSQAGAFGPETIVVLQTLASQIAVAIRNASLTESIQVNIHELERVYRGSRSIAEAKSETEMTQAVSRILQDSPYAAAMLLVRENRFEAVSTNEREVKHALETALDTLASSVSEIQKFLSGNPIIIEEDTSGLPAALKRFVSQLNHQSVALLPITQDNKLAGLILLGGRKQALTSAIVQPYVGMTDLINAGLDKIVAATERQERLRELESINSIQQAVASTNDLHSFFSTLHAQVRRVIGDYPFIVALYEKETESISIPYMYEDEKIDSIEAFPLGEGLSSILIRTLQPLLLVEDTERQAEKLGAKTHGKPAKSWMGAPIAMQGEPIGALIVQDMNHEHAFSEENMHFLSALGNQVAGVIYNVRLLEESRRHTFQLETAAQIARDISGSLNLDELLKKAVGFICERFNFYHASIFLIDLSGEFAVIREATGEAGSQMKRAGHKLGVGSKSVVGYVAGRGEPLVVHDTTKDATYYANPLLPETRSEAAIPLKVSERTVGVLDVQSVHPYAFTEDDMRTLQILADQLAVAVINSELFAETQEHLSQHRLLHHITSTVASGTTLEEALESAVSGLQVTLGGDRVAILMPDAERKYLEVKASVGYSQEVNEMRVPIESGITGWVTTHRRLLRVDNVTEDPRYIEASPNTRSELAIPLLYRNEVLGVLNVESEQIGAYTENDEEMLGTLGGSLAAIIANARLLEQVRSQAEHNRLIYEITNKIRRTTDMQTILTTTASELTKAVGARRTKIAIAPKTGNNGNDSSEKGGKSA
jgi:GAF domain-containing protein/HAMP domain-containing protein